MEPRSRWRIKGRGRIRTIPAGHRAASILQSAGSVRSNFAEPARQQAFDTYLGAVDLADRRIELLDRQLDELSGQGPWAGLVGKLRCLRGVDTLTAIGIVCEVGDFDRFHSAQQFMSFVGLVPSERTSGDKRRQGSITGPVMSCFRKLAGFRAGFVLVSAPRSGPVGTGPSVVCGRWLGAVGSS